MVIQKFGEFIAEAYTNVPLPKKEERLISFTRKAFDQFNSLIREDRSMQDRVIKIIEDIIRDPFRGIGKPEMLQRRGKDHGHLNKASWSRRISDEHRIVYEVSSNDIKITSCKGHYDDK